MDKGKKSKRKARKQREQKQIDLDREMKVSQFGFEFQPLHPS